MAVQLIKSDEVRAFLFSRNLFYRDVREKII